MIFKYFLLLICIFVTCLTNTVRAETGNSTVLVVMPYSNGEYSKEMTGFVVSGSSDVNGHQYIITARHGIEGDNGEGFSDVQGIALYGWNNKQFLGFGKVEYCDSQWGDKATIVEHDYCVLSIPEPTESYLNIPGYSISRNMPTDITQVCGSFPVSWTSGASGSPLLVNDNVIGILSMTNNENTISYNEWLQNLKNNNLDIPKKIIYPNDPPSKIVTKSCGYFPSVPPSILAFLGNATLLTHYVNGHAPDGTSYETFGYPELYQMHMSGQINFYK